MYEVLGPHRLAARTPGSHPGNRGSIPGEVTTKRILLDNPAPYYVYVMIFL